MGFFPLSRTATAFAFTCERLAHYNPELYFWTFTFRQVPFNDTWAMWQYNFLSRKLKNIDPLLRGIRVVELHRSHGIHFHALINRRIPIDRVRRMGWPHGFGRMSVQKADLGSASYMAKYLTKQYREDNGFGQRRRWGAIGGFPVTRCRDVVYDTDYTRNHQAMFGGLKVPYGLAMLLRSYSDVWGECWQWPPFIRTRCQDALRVYYKELTYSQLSRCEKLGFRLLPECPF